MGVLGMLVAVLTVFVSRRGVLLGLLMLAVGVVVGRLQVMVRGHHAAAHNHLQAASRRTNPSET